MSWACGTSWFGWAYQVYRIDTTNVANIELVPNITYVSSTVWTYIVDDDIVINGWYFLNQKSCSYPFCQKIQMESQYRALFLDDAIAPILLEKIAENTKEGYVTWLMSHSLLTFEQAESVFYFQMNGCLSINRLMLRNHCNDWKQIQTTIDKFIKAGLESFLIHDQREENASDNFCSKISPTVTASSTLR